MLFITAAHGYSSLHPCHHSLLQLDHTVLATTVANSCRNDPLKQVALNQLRKGRRLAVAGRLEIYQPDQSKQPRLSISVESMASVTQNSGEGLPEEEEEDQ